MKKTRFSGFCVVCFCLIGILGACGEVTPLPATTITNAANLTTTGVQTTQPTTVISANPTQPVTSTTAQTTTLGGATSSAAPTSVSASPTPTSEVVPTATETSSAEHHNFERVITIVLENTDYSEAMANPYLAQLAKSGTLLTNFFAITHPSYPNYLALVGGSTFGSTDDGQQDYDKTNLADLMEKAGISWKVYAEGLPSQSCYKGVQAGSYVRKHEPFVSFLDVQRDPTRCAKIVNSEQFKTDMATGKVPQYSLYVPDLNDDGHDTGVKYSADWLKNFLPPLLENPSLTQDTLFMITFDEGRNGSSNQIYTLLLGQPVKVGATNNTRYNHYSLLRTIEDNFNLGTLGREDAKASPIIGVWNNK